MAEGDVLLGLGKVFTLLFVTLGPIKIVGPFLQLTRDADDSRNGRLPCGHACSG